MATVELIPNMGIDLGMEQSSGRFETFIRTFATGEDMKTQKTWKVLLIDDDPGIVKVMSVAMEDQGYEVVTASDGKSGVEACIKESPDIIITDIRMPGLDGIEVLRRIKELDPDKEVIVSTAFNDIRYAVSALQLDASDFVMKPVGEDALTVALQRARQRCEMRRNLRDYMALIEERWMDTSEALARTYHTQELLIDSSIDGIVASDNEGRITVFNRSMEMMLGCDRRKAMGARFDGLFCPGEAEKFRKATDSPEYGGEGRLFLYESCLAGDDGTRVPVQVSAARMVQAGEEMGLVCFFRDEREIRKMAQDAANHARVLQQDKMISLGRLAASVVHEINNPLAGILNYARLMSRLLSRGNLSPESAEKFRGYLRLAESELERCSKIVSNLLAFSRKSKLEFGPVDVNELLNRCVNLSGHKMALQNIRVEAVFAGNLPKIRGDFNQLQQCVINLIFNAIDAMPKGGVLTLTSELDAEKNLVKISVRDTGCGIPGEDLLYVFDPFFTTKTEGKGLGLGLSTTFGIIDRHKGTIRVKSEPGKGALFTIQLPAGGDIPESRTVPEVY
ncbi:MAG: response regulator [Desulfobacteraceae bacterium]|nr:response regulator [Desulfobacteraceae bacterium]